MGCLVELRLLEGPNLYFPRAALKLTLDVAALEGASPGAARRVAQTLGVHGVAPGAPGTSGRRAFCSRVLRVVSRRLSGTAGVSRLAVRVRPGPVAGQAILAVPWRHSGRAEAFGQAVATVVDELLGSDPVSMTALLERCARQVRDSEPGREPRAVRPHVPTVCVTGTNGKTTTTRLLAHMGMTAGLTTAWSSTDGVFAQGRLVEAGDYSGPSGGWQVLATEGLDLALLETARGGMLLKGMGVVSNDVSVVTNVSADHLGLQGIDTVDQLAEVKAIITRVTRPDGWVVLNGDDPRVLAMRAGSPARPFVFSLDPDSPSLREALTNGGRAVTVMDGFVTVLDPGADPDLLVRVIDLPVTMAGLSDYNVANALAATAAGLSIGIARDVVVEALRSFTPDATLNPGRLNTFSLPVEGGECTVVIDLAHNEAGLEALMRVTRGLVAPGARLLAVVGAVGDRTDELITAMGEIAAKAAESLRISHRDKYLRGRTHAELEALLRAGAASVGVHDVPVSATEIQGLADTADHTRAGDVLAVLVHDDRQGVYAWLAEHGATPDSPAQIRAKAAAHLGLHPLEDEIASAAALPAATRIERVRELLQRRPHDARLRYELATALEESGAAQDEVRDSYRRALDDGLVEPRRSDAALALALSLLAGSEPAQAVELLQALRADRTGNPAVDAALVMALQGAGRGDEAALLAVASLTAYADAGGRTEQLRSLSRSPAGS